MTGGHSGNHRGVQTKPTGKPCLVAYSDVDWRRRIRGLQPNLLSHRRASWTTTRRGSRGSGTYSPIRSCQPDCSASADVSRLFRTSGLENAAVSYSAMFCCKQSGAHRLTRERMKAHHTPRDSLVDRTRMHYHRPGPLKSGNWRWRDGRTLSTKAKVPIVDAGRPRIFTLPRLPVPNPPWTRSSLG